MNLNDFPAELKPIYLIQCIEFNNRRMDSDPVIPVGLRPTILRDAR